MDNSFENIKGERISSDTAVMQTFTNNIAHAMSEKVGWLNRDIAINMTGFPLYHLNIEDSEISLNRGQVKLASVIFREDGSMMLYTNPDEFKCKNIDDFCSKVSDLCLSSENIEALKKFTHNGVELIVGIKLDDRVYVVNTYNPVARQELARKYNDVTFTNTETFATCLGEYVFYNSQNYVDNYPEMIYLEFNGLQISDVGVKHVDDVWKGFLNDCEEIRKQLNEEAGLEPRMFLYHDAVYPAKILSDSQNSISFATQNSAEELGKICYKNKEFHFMSADKSQRYKFSGKDEALSFVKDNVLSKKNIDLAKGEAETYKKEMSKKTQLKPSSKK